MRATPKMIVACDPGLSGGFAIGDDGAFSVQKMPETDADIVALLRANSDAELWMEHVPTGMPGKGAAMAKLNRNAGLIEGAALALGMRIMRIRPAAWQKGFGLGTRSGCVSDSQWKNKLKGEAQRRFPGMKVTLQTADALLILEHALSQRKGDK